MRRREFISLLGGGAVAAWPLVARAQQPERVRRIGVLMYLAADDAEGQARLAAFTPALKQLGWSDGRNLGIDTRWATADDIRRHAAELAALAPDVLLAGTGTATVAPSLGVELSPVDVRDAGEIERAVTEFARGLNGGLIVTGSAAAIVHRELIAMLAARHRLPAVYPGRYSVTAGGLISYGPDLIDQFRRAASYVDRILKGAKPADLPVQAPVKYETVINLKTAKALGLEVPASVLARADEVIEWSGAIYSSHF